MEILGIVASAVGIVGIVLCFLGTLKLTGLSSDFSKRLASVAIEESEQPEFLRHPPPDFYQPLLEKVQALSKAVEALGPGTRCALWLLTIGLALQAVPYVNAIIVASGN